MKKMYFLYFTVLPMVMSGCAQKSYYAHADIACQMKPATSVGIIIGAARCYQVGAGGKADLHVEKTEVMRACIERSAAKAFSESGYEAKTVAFDRDIAEVLETYETVRRNIANQFPGEEESAPNPANFGDLVSLMDRHKVDVLAVIYAFDEDYSYGRTAMKVAWNLIWATNTGDYTGWGSYTGNSFADMGLIDRNGRLFYYDRASGDFKLTNEKSAEKVFRRFVKNITNAKNPP